MKRQKETFLVAILIFSIHFGFSQNFQWAGNIEGVQHPYTDLVSDIVVDNDGNTYIFGRTESIIFDLDPTSGTDIVTNDLIYFGAVYLQKLDTNGNYLWGKLLGNYRGSDYSHEIKIGNDGNIYTLSQISEYNASQNVINSNITVTKLNPDGVIVSTIEIPQTYGSPFANNNLYPHSFDLDEQNNIFISGYFLGTITLNPANPSLTLNTTYLSHFLIKVDNSGNFQWAKQFDNNSNESSKVLVRPDGNINLLSDGSQGSTAGYNLYNIDTQNGSVIWQKSFLNQKMNTFSISESDIIIIGTKVINDNAIPIDLDPSATGTNLTFCDTYILFLDLEGNYADSKEFYYPISGTPFRFTACTSDSENNYHFTGYFSGGVDFDPSDAVYELTPGGASSYSTDAFYLRLDENRNFENAIHYGSETPLMDIYHVCGGVAPIDLEVINDDIYIGGNFSWTCDFDPSPVNTNTFQTVLEAQININGFIQKLGPCRESAPNGNESQTFCEGSNPTVSNLIPNSSSIKWYDSATATTHLANNTLLVNGSTYYAASQIGNCAESPRLAVTVAINPTPQQPIVNSQSFCESDVANISNIVITGQDIKWYASDGNANALPPDTEITGNTTYYASQTVNGCESSRTPVTIIINSAPLPTATSPQKFCIQQNAMISSVVISGSNINWYDQPTGDNLLPATTLLINGTYYATQNTNGCESLRLPVSITVDNTVPPNAQYLQTLCASQNPTINDINVTGTDIAWYDSENGTNTIPGTTLLTDGVTYYASQTLNGCESAQRTAVKVTLVITLNANDYSVNVCDDQNNDYEIIDLESYRENLVPNAQQYTFEYYYTNNGASHQTASDKIANPNQYELTTVISVLYVRIISDNGCHQVVSLTLKLIDEPKISIPDTVYICENKEVVVDAGNGFDSYLWSTGANSQIISISVPGTYSVTVTKLHGDVICFNTKDFTVALSNPATILDIETIDMSENNSITIHTSGFGNYEYSLDGFNYQESNTFTGLSSGIYMVYIRDSNGCGIVKKQVYLLMYPKFFSPNGDGSNDTWSIQFSHYEYGLKTWIFDRYGKFLAELNRGESWDGSYNGQLLPSNDYWFLVTRRNGEQYRGHFTLKR